MRWHRYAASNGSSKLRALQSHIAPARLMRLPPLHVVVPSAAVVREISEYPEKRLYQNPASITALTMMARNLQIMNLRKTPRTARAPSPPPARAPCR